MMVSKLILFTLLSCVKVDFSRALDRSCGRSRTYAQQRYIIGGRPAREGEFPWMVSLQFIKEHAHFCGGSLITADFVLTAAHCLSHTSPHEVRVTAGYINHKRKGDYHQSRLVREFIIHEKYGTFWKNDIGLLRLKKPFDLNKSEGHIGTVCLPTENVKPNTPITVSGWGRLSEYGRLPNLLRAATVTVRKNWFCRKGEKAFIPRIMFCAGYPEKDTCDRDSGSPAVQRKRGVVFQVGIVSYGRPCGEHSGYYTRVFSYRKWIEYNIGTAHDVKFFPNKVMNN